MNKEPKIDHRMMMRKYRWERGENGLVGEKKIECICVLSESDPNSVKVGSGFPSNFVGGGFLFLKFFFKVVLCFSSYKHISKKQ